MRGKMLDVRENVGNAVKCWITRACDIFGVRTTREMVNKRDVTGGMGQVNCTHGFILSSLKNA